jgi:hypothetical protein
MAVWTIASQEGTAGERIAAELAASAGVPLLDRHALMLCARELDPTLPLDDDVVERVGGRLQALALSLAITTGDADVVNEIRLRQALPQIGRTVLARAARSPCVIHAPGAFAALSEHASAIHVRVRAPLEWRIAAYRRQRIAAYRRQQLVDRHAAVKALRHDDHLTQAWVRSLYRVDIDDASLFSLVVDASRFSTERLVETLLAAGGGLPETSKAGQATRLAASTAP